MTNDPNRRTTAGLRASLLDLLETLSSRELQQRYQDDVPIANVPAELVCGWFDDLYLPEVPGFVASFGEAELEALAEFNRVFDSLVDSLPETHDVQVLWEAPAWQDIEAAAVKAMGVMELRAPRADDALGAS